MTRDADTLADWFIGGPGKRPLLEVLVGSPGDRFYTQAELAELVGLHPNGSVSRHLEVLQQAGLVARAGSRGPYRLELASPLIGPLRNFLETLAVLAATDPRWQRPLPPGRGGR